MGRVGSGLSLRSLLSYFVVVRAKKETRAKDDARVAR